MNKTQSQIIKGYAILMMVFLHLFNNAGYVAGHCNNLCFVKGIPFATWMTRAMIPVALFIFISGYGLEKRREEKRREESAAKLLRLFTSFWIVSAIFVTIGHFVNPERYPGSFVNVLRNITSFDTSWNPEMWFLFPYSVMFLCRNYIFKLIDRFHPIKFLIVVYVIGLASSVVCTKWIDFVANNRYIYNIFLCINLLFSFSLGAITAKCELIEQWQKYVTKTINTHLAWVLIPFLILSKCVVSTSLYGTPYMIAFIALIVIAPHHKFVHTVLSYLGKYSMWIWMVHTYYCIYLFRLFFYSFSYPILIYIAVIGVSLLTAILLSRLQLTLTQMVSKVYTLFIH
jgi:hypothetical protein